MFAIIKTGGKQYRVQANDEIYVEKLSAEAGSKVTFDEVLMLNDEIGTPFIKGATVEGEVVKNGKGKKIVIFKYKPKKDYRRKTGHRQEYTLVKITKVGA
jgi:large subunit ribosomal protein L21